TDDLGGREGSQSASGLEAAARRQTMEEPSGVKIACAGDVQYGVDPDRLDLDRFLSLSRDHRAFGTPCQNGQLRVRASQAHGLIERADLVERRDLALVGNQNVDAVPDQGKELFPVAIDAEAVGQGERHFSSG